MAGTTRERAISALFALLQKLPGLTTPSRRLTNPEGMDPTLSPALFLVCHQDTTQRASSEHPPLRILQMRVLLYNDVGTDQNAIPETPVNNLIDAIETLLLPNPLTGLQTLGGLVYHCFIEGDVVRSSGDITGKSMAVVPVKIVLP